MEFRETGVSESLYFELHLVVCSSKGLHLVLKVILVRLHLVQFFHDGLHLLLLGRLLRWLIGSRLGWLQP